MTSKYILLKNELNDELDNLERVINKVLKAYQHFERASTDQELYIDSAALNIHSFYAGVEKLLINVANKVDQYLPSGSSWHKDLLEQMSTPIDRIRPIVINKALKERLLEFLDFRHVVRNIYTYNFNAKKIEHLVELLPEVFGLLRDEIVFFTKFLDEVGMAS